MIVLLLIAAGPAGGEEALELLPEGIAEEIRGERRIESLSREVLGGRLGELLYHYRDLRDEPDAEALIYRAEKPSFPFITAEKAKADAEFLISVLKYGYAGYRFFGGDERFSRAEAEIEAAVEERPKLFSLIRIGVLEEILAEHFRFIQDGHFSIGGGYFCRDYYWFVNPDYTVQRDAGGYYWVEDGEQHYIRHIEDEELERYLKPVLRSDGRVVRRLSVLSQSEERSISVTLGLRRGNAEETREVQLERPPRRASGGRFPRKSGEMSNRIYRLYEKEGIPVVELRSFFGTSPEKRKQLEQFTADAAALRGEKHIIVDIRGNSGGTDLYAADWVKSFSGEEPGSTEGAVTLTTETAVRLLENNARYHRMGEELRALLREEFPVDEQGWSEVEYPAPKRIANETLVILLTDNGVGSAGESFCEYLRQMENVLVIGTNTAGVNYITNQGRFLLPHSKIPVNCGITFNFAPDLQYREGMGYLPDLWINPDEALEAAVEFLTTRS
jgi:hypothetical protein